MATRDDRSRPGTLAQIRTPGAMSRGKPSAAPPLALASALVLVISGGLVSAALAAGPVGSTSASTVAHASATAPAQTAPRLRDVSMIAARTAALLMSNQSGGDIEATLAWNIEAGASEVEPAAVSYVVEVRGSSLLEDHDDERLVVGVYGYLLDGERRIVGHIAKATEIHMKEHEARLRQSGLKIRCLEQLDPGRHTLRLLIRNHQTDRFSLLMTGIDVPSASDAGSLVLPPRFAEPVDGWLCIDDPSMAASKSEDGPARSAAAVHRWAAKPVLVDGHPSQFELLGVGWSDAPTLEALILDRHGRTYDTPPVQIDQLSHRPGSLMHLRATMAPVDVPAGEYRLVLQMASAGGPTVRRTTPVVILPEKLEVVWASKDLDRLDNTIIPAASNGRRTRIDSRRARLAYHEALAVLASGEVHIAQRLVADLERTTFSNDLIRGLAELEQIELETARELHKNEPQSVAPLIMLHHELFRSYMLRKESPLATHSWRLTADLAELAGSRKARPETRTFCTRTMLSLAGFLIEGSSSRQAASLLKRTLRLEPRNPAALHGLAVLHERAGRYQEAITPLVRLIAARPSSHEARLRLAINQARVGHERRSMKGLRRLVHPATPEWIRALASQELARLLMDREGSRSAARFLKEAVEALPDNQRLRIMLAYALDQQNRPWEAGDLVGALEAGPGSSLGTPRLRYASWQPLAFNKARKQLETVARARLGVLAASLEGQGIEVSSRASLAMQKAASGYGGSLSTGPTGKTDGHGAAFAAVDGKPRRMIGSRMGGSSEGSQATRKPGGRRAGL